MGIFKRPDKLPAPFSALATEEDVRYCYRLLLGREPDSAGMRHFHAAIRNTSLSLDDLVEGFLQSPEFKGQRSRRVSSASNYVCVELDGFQLCVSAADPMLGRHLQHDKVYEPNITAVFRQTVKPGMTVVDAGANVGYYTMLAAKQLAGQGKVIAFEAAPETASLLHYNVELNGVESIVNLFPFALADTSRLMALDIHGSNGILSRFEGGLGELAGRTLVRCVSLDRVLQLDRWDILKIDVEGTEGLVIKGADEHLRRHRPIVFSEFAPLALEAHSGTSGRDYLAYWVSLGYRINIIHRSGAVESLADDIDATMDRWEKEQWGHIDLLLQPS